MQSSVHNAARLSWQKALFAEGPLRRELTQLSGVPGLRTLRCSIHRNHAFEHVASVLNPYLRYAGLEPSYTYSAYDDSLSFGEVDGADLHVLWLDLGSYGSDLDLSAWLSARVANLRARTAAPILAIYLDRDEPITAPEGPGIYCASLTELALGFEAEGGQGTGFLDPKRAPLTGSRLSGRGAVAVARKLGTHWIPGIFAAPRRALVLDLDHTLYRGVLGEDGPLGVELTPSHGELQRAIKDLQAQGVFLCMASRNELADVQELFELRGDFPLGWADFSVHQVSWGSKADAISEAAAALGIGVDSMLFVDDNPGEVLDVARAHPALQVLLAGPEGEDTLRALRHAPGFFRWRQNAEDQLRVADVLANGARVKLAGGGDEQGAGYLASLGAMLTFRKDHMDLVPRAAELASKTNQFNLTLARTDEQGLARYVADESRSLVTVRLEDRLSDSGVIAMVAGRREGSTLMIDELCISCRALGRGIESTLIAGACRDMAEGLGVESITFLFRDGPRNGPARHWIDGEAGVEWGQAQPEVPLVEAHWRALPSSGSTPVVLHGLRSSTVYA